MEKIYKPRVAIIDYNMGNMFSVYQACLHTGFDPVITSDKSLLLQADAAILPGVGAFGQAMKFLEKADLVSPVKDFISSGKPFMGICLGFQLLFNESEEFGSNRGLEIFPGVIKKFPASEGIRIPQIGWNKIIMQQSFIDNVKNNTPLSDIENGAYMYFVHSYYAEAEDNNITATTTEYAGINYCSSVYSDNVFASQFHPEKSAADGIKIYRNWYNKVIYKNQELLCQSI